MPSTLANNSSDSATPYGFFSSNSTMPQRLPAPYRDENIVIAAHLATLQGALDWAAAARDGAPWVQAVRRDPPPFWAMETLLREYPISSSEGLALMRLA